MSRTHTPSPVLGLLAAASVLAACADYGPTPDEQKHTLHWLQQRACIEPGASGFAYTEDPFVPCIHNEDCPGVGAGEACLHRSWVEPDDRVLFPQLTFPPEPRSGGAGEAYLRYVPLCEDGSGDHEWSSSAGLAGTPPTCDPGDWIRCASGVRPRYRADHASDGSNDWLIHAGGGGHASAPNASGGDPGLTPWAYAHSQDAGAYTLSQDPLNRFNTDGIFDASPANPFHTYNRVWIEKCTPDRWLGNRAHTLEDFSADHLLEVVTGACTDTDGSGTANCADQAYCDAEWDASSSQPQSCADAGYPAVPACACTSQNVPPPNWPDPFDHDHSYTVYYHGKRIVRAVWADLDGGIATYDSYPIDLAAGVHEVFPQPDGQSTVAFHCHSNGCNGLQGGHIDELRDRIQADHPGAQVLAFFNSFFGEGVEVEYSVSNYDGVDAAPEDDVPDNDGIIDDGLSVYDHVVDSEASTLQPMSDATFLPGGILLQHLVDWWDPSLPGYASEPVDASCLAHHCPGSADWTSDPLCAPCNESMHVLLNHLQTPFLYNQAQRDSVLNKRGRYCEDELGSDAACDYRGLETEAINGSVDVRDTHWRKLVRKGLADLFRDGQLLRCEGGVGNEAPYDDIVLLSPDWGNHGPLSELDVATKQLGNRRLARYARDFADGGAPTPYLCLQDDGLENAADFTGVASCN